MRVIPQLIITPAMLVSTSVPEVITTETLWAIGTTYAAAAPVYVVRTKNAIDLYTSKAAGNLAHAPTAGAADTYWNYVGQIYGAYAGGTTYAKGDWVTDAANHDLYESQIASNTGNALSDTTKWTNVGKTNRWNPFDVLRNTRAASPNTITYTLAAGKRTSSIAVVGLIASEVDIVMTISGSPVYSQTVKLSRRNTRSWKQYYFGTFSYRTAVQFFDLPLYKDAQITVTVKRSGTGPAVGGIILGNAVYIGEMQYKAVSDHLNFSTITRNFAGDLTLVPRRSVPKLKGQVFFKKELTRDILDLREATNGIPAVFSGLDDFTLDYFEPVFVYGLPKEFSIDLETYSDGSIQLEVEEM